MRIVRIALAQVNTTVGDLEGNAALVLRGIAAAREAKADLVVFPELTLTGYPPEDLVLRRQFIDDNLKVLKEVVRKITGVAAVLGFIDRGEGLYNAAALCMAAGSWLGIIKYSCPTTECSTRTDILSLENTQIRSS